MRSAAAPAWIPMAQPRPAEAHKRGRHKTPARSAVEEVLRTSPMGLGPVQIAIRCVIPLGEARRILSKLCDCGDAHNVNLGARGSALYKWGRPPLTQNPAPERGAYRKPGHYDGRELRPFTGRPGAMDAFALPSLQGGVLVERRVPMLIASNPDVRL